MHTSPPTLARLLLGVSEELETEATRKRIAFKHGTWQDTLLVKECGARVCENGATHRWSGNRASDVNPHTIDIFRDL